MWWDIPQPIVDFAAGVGDVAIGATLGLVTLGNFTGPEARAALGIDGGISESGAYKNGVGAGLLGTLGLGRLGMGSAKPGDIQVNAAQGKAGEAITRASLGGRVAGEQVTFKTSDGTRTRADFVTTDKSVVETKTGNATLSTGQSKLQADIQAGREVTPVGENAAKAGLKPNEPTKMRCFQVDRPC